MTPATRRCSRPGACARPSRRACAACAPTTSTSTTCTSPTARSPSTRPSLPWASFVKEGKVRAIGVSNFSAWQIGDVFAACDALGTPRPILAQQLYNLVARRIEAEYVEFATTKGLATIVYNPLGGGLLTGRHSFTESPGEGRFGSSALATMYRDRYWNAETFAVIEALGAIASEAGITLPELSLRWLLSKPVVSAVLLGGSKPHQLEANITAAQAGPLPDDVVAACDEAGLALAGSMPGYNR